MVERRERVVVTLFLREERRDLYFVETWGLNRSVCGRPGRGDLIW